MKIIIDENIDNEEEIIIKCSKIDEKILNLISLIESRNNNMLVTKDGRTIKIDISEVLYFESVDKRTFLYTKQDVYEIGLRLYEIEEKYKKLNFLRISKSSIINLIKIESIKSILGGRLEVILDNNEKLIVSRQYIKDFKKELTMGRK